jgi:hypothetical protein
MARTSKIKFNIEDFFIEGQHDAVTKQKIIASSLFPIAATMYNTAEKQLRIGMAVFNGDGSVCALNLVSPLGINIARLTAAGQQITAYVPWSGLERNPSKALLSSINPKYVQAKLRQGSSHPNFGLFESAVRNAHDKINYLVREFADVFIDNLNGRSVTGRPEISSLDSELTTLLVRAYMGDISLIDMPSQCKMRLDSVVRDYQENTNKFKDSIKKSYDFFDGNKWVYITDINDGVILGAISPEPVRVALDKYVTEGRLPYTRAHSQTPYQYIKPEVEFKWYKSFDCIPEPLKGGLEYSIAMLKAHRATDDSLFSEHGDHFWPEMGAARSWSSHISAKVLLLPM